MENHKFEIQKIDYLLQVVSIGISCKILAGMTNDTPQNWLNKVKVEAERAIKAMTPDLREKIVSEYLDTLTHIENSPNRKSVVEIRTDRIKNNEAIHN
jgi:hypothetical protein